MPRFPKTVVVLSEDNTITRVFSTDATPEIIVPSELDINGDCKTCGSDDIRYDGDSGRIECFGVHEEDGDENEPIPHLLVQVRSIS